MNKFLFSLLLIILFSCSSNNINTPEETSSTFKPKGLFSSSFGNESALDNNQVKGSLIRVKWSDLEPSKGVYDFSKINQFLIAIKSRNLKWSLGIIAGGDSPDWLIDSFGATYFEINGIDNTIKRIPKIWDSKVNERLTYLAQALEEAYANDEDLVLIYVPQMTANGIEGHFNGVTNTELINTGFTADKWVNSVKETAKIFANSFSNKAIAVEVHDIINDTSIPNRIITDLWNDSSLNKRVGAAMWWISGKTTYQPNLINVLSDFPGDIYAQAIGRSDQIERFKDNDYTSIFSQAQTIGIRYIELWEYEFVNNTFSAAFENFNNYTQLSFD
ncbi:beta-galactosidase [Lutibacter sp. A64]|uniref:beta-galactosidase n=1 Tax=Lutibacter sp. A64 TaxID=2918526 RepID=UPI001F05FE95|nr:beta-galactosidase [Lutibacter sp. A64]UMB53300.1 beta-galactosidase [Lutibacter sp. A64]